MKAFKKQQKHTHTQIIELDLKKTNCWNSFYNSFIIISIIILIEKHFNTNVKEKKKS